MTIVSTPAESRDHELHPQYEQVRAALYRAAEQIGRGNYEAGLYRQQVVRGRVVAGYSLTEEHAAVIEALKQLETGEIGPEAALGVLHGDLEMMRQRFGSTGLPALLKGHA